MKTVHLMGLAIMGAAGIFPALQHAHAEGDAIRAPSKVIACNLNKSYSLVASYYENAGTVDRVELITRDFMGRDEQPVARMERPAMQFIDYGNVTMMSQDFGRTGYAFLRLERKGPKAYDGYIDIDIYTRRSIRTDGHMLEIPCYEVAR